MPRHLVQGIRVGDRQRPEQYGVDQAESCHAGAYGQSERQDRSNRRDFVLSELGKPKDGVLSKKSEPGGQPCVAAGFAMTERGAESAARLASVASVFDCFVEVRLHLLGDLIVELF